MRCMPGICLILFSLSACTSVPVSTSERKTELSELLRSAYVGMSEADVIAKRGAPSEKADGVWSYPQRLGPGAHSFRFVDMLTFHDGYVVDAETRMVPIGCILIDFKPGYEP